MPNEVPIFGSTLLKVWETFLSYCERYWGIEGQTGWTCHKGWFYPVVKLVSQIYQALPDIDSFGKAVNVE